MSFFGFDPTAPPPPGALSQPTETLDFNDLEEDDAFNAETFGSAAVSNINDDFDFSLGGAANVKQNVPLKPAPIPTNNANMSYAKAAHSSLDDSLQPMASLWGNDDNKQGKQTQPEQQQEQPQQKIMTVEEIEAKLKEQSLNPQQPQQQYQQQPQQPSQPPQFQLPPYITQMLMQPHVQQQILGAVSAGRFPNVQIATQAMVQMLMGAPNPMLQQPVGSLPNSNPALGVPPNVQQMQQMQQLQMQQFQMMQMQMQQQQQQQAQTQAHAINQDQQQQQPTAPQSAQQVAPQTAPHATPQIASQSPLPVTPQQLQPQTSAVATPPGLEQKTNLNDFPSIEIASAQSHGHVNHTAAPLVESSDTESESENQHQQPSFNQGMNNRSNRGNFGNNNNNNNNFHNQRHHHHNNNFQRHQQFQQQLDRMTPEERNHFLIRHQKVQKITRCSGFMTPKDKDFVTRFQLSQIVTEDPYNEDFYSQVYKVINSSTAENNMNSLAQKYLEQSGHRLGGRSKRADIALQRMQQQVSKAVSVAKERGESTGILTKAGALGKVSFGSGKQPRKQLMIHQDAEVDIPKEQVFSKSSRAFQLSIIEKIYNEVLKLESLERESQPYDSNELWKSLHLNDVVKTASGEVVNPFISVLGFNKMIKLFGRMFHFFNDEQKLELVSQLFIHLHDVDVIRKGSYINYESTNYEIPENVVAQIDLFYNTIFKTLVIYLSEAHFINVLTWLNSIVEKKTALFLSSTKIGLSLITILISRLELIKQEFSNTLNPQVISQWGVVYDQFFSLLEGRLTTCFPPYLSHDDSKKVTNKNSKDDDSYIWQFLASLALTGQLHHQRIIVDEIRNEIFGVMAVAKDFKSKGDLESSARYLSNLNLFLNAMGLIATEDDITQLSD